MRHSILPTLGLALITCFSSTPAAAEEVWTGPMTTFTRADNVDGTDPANMDQITGAVWITRLTGGGSIWNGLVDPLANFTPCDGPYPTDTEWAIGDIADYAWLTYGPFLSSTFANCSPNSNLNPSLPGVLHLISEDIYIPIQFLSWTSGGAGGFSYVRGTPPLPGTFCENVTLDLAGGIGSVNPADLVTVIEQQVVSVSGDDGLSNGLTDFTVPITSNTDVTFFWMYTTVDGPAFDNFGYLVDGVYTQLTDNGGAIDQSGTETVILLAGQTFGFRSVAVDGLAGPSTTTVGNFEPGFSGQFDLANWTRTNTTSDGDTHIQVAQLDPSQIALITASQTDFSCADLGVVPVSVTVDNVNGSTTGCSDATVTVSDPTMFCSTTDLAITKTDGVTAAAVGQSLTYTIVVSNNGPVLDPSAAVDDAFPAGLTCSWTTAAAGGATGNGSGTGDISESLTMPAGGSVTYTAVCEVGPAALGTLVNTANVVASLSDPDPGNNSATDNDTFVSSPIFVNTNVARAVGGIPAGTSWADAFDNLQDALAVATAGRSIWVAGGVYYPDLGIGQINNNEASTFVIPNGVSVYGGFAGTETMLWQRDVHTFVTVLSGDIDGNDVTDPHSVTQHWTDIQGSNADHVVTAGGSDSTTVLDGFTLTGGDVCDGTYGAALTCLGGGGPTLTNLTVTGNRAGCGAGGGGVARCTSAVVSRSFFSNSTSLGGGAWFGGGSFTDVVFEGNTSSFSGGAIFSGGGDVVELDRCAFADNSANRGGAIWAETGAELLLDTVLISGNQAQEGAGIWIAGTGNHYLGNVTLTGNRAVGGSGLAGGVYFASDGALLVYNTIVWNNSDVTGVGTLDAQITITGAGTGFVSHSDVQGSGGSSGWLLPSLIDLGGNIDSDPLFLEPVDPATAPTTVGDLRLITGSPAIDAGNNAVVTLATDLAGDARIQNGVVDMGAYEGGNSATADLAITATDGVTMAVPGDSLTYTIVASNAGPSDDASVSVSDTFPVQLACSWTSVAAGGASGNTDGSGDLSETLTMPAGSSVTYTALCNIDPGAYYVLLSNTAVIASLTSTVDPVPGNNSATDGDTDLYPEADLAITKTDGVTSATPGGTVTYTIVASNAGPSDNTTVWVIDAFPAELSCSWTAVMAGGATGSTSGLGNLNSPVLDNPVNMPTGSSVAYTAACDIDPAATGTLSNTAEIYDGTMVADPVPGNNTATDSDTVLIPEADLSISNTDGVTSATPGGTLTYAIVAGNAGPSDVSGVSVTDTFPADLTCSWTSNAAGGATGNTNGSGNLADTLSMPSGSSVTYTATCDIDPAATGTLSNTATISSPPSDPNPGNNSATDGDTELIVAPIFDDGFETGDTSRWSASVPPTVKLASYPDDPDRIQVDLVIDTTKRGVLTVKGLAANGGSAWQLELDSRRGSELHMVMTTLLADGSRAVTEPVFVVGDLLDLRLEWRRAWDEGSSNGEMHLLVNGAEVAWLTGLDNHGQTVTDAVAIGNISALVNE